MGTSTISDGDLLQRVDGGDLAALTHIVEEHLHPAWRLAVVASPDLVVAERAVVDGFCDGLAAAIRQPDPRLGIRTRLAAATRHAATTIEAGTPAVDPDPVIAAFRALPEAWRTALWLVEVEGGSAEQVAPVLGLNRSAAAAVADRAAAGLRERLAADVAERATDVECRRSLAKLPAHAAGKLTETERDAVGTHLAGCGSCAVWLAALVAPRPALRRLITPPPPTVALTIESRWLELLEKRGKGWLTPLTERAVGAAAAAVLAVGLAGAALLGGRDRGDAGPELAMPAGAEPARDDTPTGGATTIVPPVDTGTTGGSGGGTGGSGGSTTGTSTTGGATGAGTSGGGTTSGDLPRSLGGTTPGTTPPTTAPPTAAPDSPSSPPPAEEQPAPTTVGVPGVLEVELQDDRVGVDVLDGAVGVGLGGPEGIEIDIPGLL